MAETEKTMTPAREKLIRDAARKLRGAWKQRESDMQAVLDDYDRAVEQDDEEDLQGQSTVLLVMIGLHDPVRAILHQFAQVDRMLKSAEGESVDGS